MSEPNVEEKKRPAKLEDVAEETGEAIGKGLKKAWNVTKSFGRGLVDALDKQEEQREPQSFMCPHCHASAPPNSNYCASCGKKL